MAKRKNKNKGRQKAVQAHRLAPIAEQALTNFSNKTKDWLASYADMDKDAEKRPMANDFDRSARSEYDEFEKELDDEEDDDEDDEFETVRDKMYRTRAAAMGWGYSSAAMQKRRNEENKRASKRTITQAHGATRLGSVEALLQKILFKAGHPMHINSLIDALLSSGHQTKSKHHFFRYVSRVLNRGYFLFDKIAPGIYDLRRSQDEAISKPKKRDEFVPSTDGLASFADVVVAFARKYKPNGASPSEMRAVLDLFLVDCTYQNVRQVMQNEELFERDGYEYIPKPIKKAKQEKQ